MSSVKWTNEQLKAIKQTGSNILVAAAAGSGKTAVLVERIINKILNQKIDIDKILIVTFTNAAASEMRERILEAIYKKIEEKPEDTHMQRQVTLLSKANICTIDSFCLDIVKNNFYEIDISPNFRIADTAELELLKLEAIEELFEEKYEEYNEDFLKILEIYTKYQDDTPLKELIINIYNYIQSNPFPEQWLNDMTEKYNIKDQINNDFSKTEWGNIILNEAKEQLISCIENLRNIIKDLEKYSELKKYLDTINQDIFTLQYILEANNWDELYNRLQITNFEKWPIDKKVTLEEKNIAKDKRDGVKKQFNKIKDLINCTSYQAIEDICDMYNILNILKNLVIEFTAKLLQKKKEKNILDFSDIEHYALNILIKEDGEPTSIALKYRNKFNEIAIDEYQDSNLVQEYILTSISTGKNIFMVGDVKQSIYKFRQARPELFLEKYEKYDLVDENKFSIEGIKIQLFKNFRSRENILDTTNIIFKNIMSKQLGDIDYNEKEYLNLGAKFESTDLELTARKTIVDIIENTSEQEDEEEINEEPIQNIELEAKYVAKKIKEIIYSNQVVFDKKLGYRKVTYRDIVILLRATKDRASYFEKEITKLDMPVFSDTSTEYLDSIEIQTIINLLKVIDNPTYDIPLVSVLRSPIGGFSDNELIKIRINNKNMSYYESVKNYNEDSKLRKKIDTFLNNINSWRKQSEYLTLYELIWKIYIDTGYYNYVSLMPNGVLRQANLKSLFEKAKQYEKASFKGLYNFINFIDKIRNGSTDLSAAKLVGENENVIRIMSIHKSKGLEFPIVFLCCSNKQFNIRDLNGPILLHQDLGIGANYNNSDNKVQFETFAKQAIKIKSKKEIIAEEMRLLYVALTRAKDRLIITGVGSDIEKSLKEKQELLSACKNKEKIDEKLLEKYKSYLDWVELVALKDNENTIKLNIQNKEQLLNEKVEEQKTFDINSLKKEEINIQLKNKLDWKYKFIEETKIETKTSVSKIKAKNTENRVTLREPNFLRKQEIISSVQKGTVVHLCLQKLPIKEKYSKQEIKEFINKLLEKNMITNVEEKHIDLDRILEFTKSNIWKELQTAKKVYKEKPFYINVKANEIYENNVDEEILVQGIIDLYYINQEDEVVLVDYKTDYVRSENELIEKYKEQLDLYKRALENALNAKVVKTYIYSTYLGKAIEVY